MADLWPFLPETPIEEMIEWRTDVLASFVAEQRLALRTAPRETLTYVHRLEGPGLARASELARRGFGTDWLVPLWPMVLRPGMDLAAGDMTIPLATAEADFRGPGFAALARADGAVHLVQIAAVRSDGLDLLAPLTHDFHNPLIAPVRRAVMIEPVRLERQHRNLGTVTARFGLRDPIDLSGIGGAALQIALDASGSMTGARMASALAAVTALVAGIAANARPAAPNDLQILTWSNTVTASILRRDAGPADYTAILNWLAARPMAVSGGTDFGVGVSLAPAFFAEAGVKRRILFFVTDGEPSPLSSLAIAKATLTGIANLEVFAINIELANTSATALLDTTPTDRVPVVPSGDTSTLTASLRSAFSGYPSHEGLDVLTDPTLTREPLSETIGQAQEFVDTGLGPIAAEPALGFLQRRAILAFRDVMPGARWRRRVWLHGLRGRQRAFWLPTWGRDLILAAPVAAADTSLVVASDADPASLIGRSLMIDLVEGPLFRRIMGAGFDALGLRLTIAAPRVDLGSGVPLHWLTKVRLDADRIDLRHLAARTEFSLPVIEVPA
jgi:uncharacterized protein YegL